MKQKPRKRVTRNRSTKSGRRSNKYVQRKIERKGMYARLHKDPVLPELPDGKLPDPEKGDTDGRNES